MKINRITNNKACFAHIKYSNNILMKYIIHIKWIYISLLEILLYICSDKSHNTVSFTLNKWRLMKSFKSGKVL